MWDHSVQVGQRLLDSLSWEPQRGTRFLIFDRTPGRAGLLATYRFSTPFAAAATYGAYVCTYRGQHLSSGKTPGPS